MNQEILDAYQNLVKDMDSRKAQEIIECIVEMATFMHLFDECKNKVDDVHPDFVEVCSAVANEMVEEQWVKGKIKEDTPLSKIWDIKRSMRQSFRQRLINDIKASEKTQTPETMTTE